MEKTAVITTVYNEAQTIREMLDSLLTQTKPPDEIVVADAGSTDGTTDIVRDYASRYQSIKLIIKPGNRSVGRNAAIAASTASIIASTDAGCEPEDTWLEEITRPFALDPSVDVVSGFYEPRPRTVFEECAGVISIPALFEVDSRTFLPSARSIAFRRSAWEQAGGFPENSDCGEDTTFDVSLRKAGCRFTFAPEALVGWCPRSNPQQIYSQYKKYSSSDGKMLNIWPHYWIAIGRYSGVGLLLALSTQIHWLLLPLGAAITAYAAKLCKKAAKRGVRVTPLHAVYLLVAIIARDLGNISGFLQGLPGGLLSNRRSR